jgi:hypothetical protein
MDFLIPLSILIPVALVITILIVIIWIVFFKNRKLYQKIISKRRRFSLYKKHLIALKNFPQAPEKDFQTLNQVVRAFFKEYFDLEYSLTYLELAEHFKTEGKEDYANFCKLMSDVNYTGEKNHSQVKQTVDLFSDIISRY